MTPEETTNQTPERREVKLNADQFSVNENGELIINNDELAQALQNAKAVDPNTPEQGVGVGVVVVF